MRYLPHALLFLVGLILALMISWPIVRMVATIHACGWAGLVVECRIVAPKLPEEE